MKMNIVNTIFISHFIR